MSSFNANDPQYTTCCCGAHITALSRFIMAVFIIGYFVEVFVRILSNGDYSKLLGFCMMCLGFYAVFNEARIALLIYMILFVFFAIISIVHLLVVAIESPSSKFPGYMGIDLSTAVYLAIFLSIVYFLVFTTYWNLAKFIMDREAAEQIHVLYQVVIEKATNAATAAHVQVAFYEEEV